MATVVSPHLLAVDAAWDAGPEAGSWIADRLGPFGASVGHAVPLGYPAYAVVPIPFTDDDPKGNRAPLIAIDALLDVLGPFTGDQPMHSGIWEGWGWLYDTGADPRTTSSMWSHVWDEDDRATQGEIESELAVAREELAAVPVALPTPTRSSAPRGAISCGRAR
jgi:hypothetical protein